jgi:DNA adenine methylase
MLLEVSESKTPLLFRYPGGKHYAIKILRPFWEAIEHQEFREPFAGGASVFFNKPKVEKNWLNDLDKELITTMKQISDPVARKKLARRFESEKANPARWREVMDLTPKSDLEVAYKYFYLNRTSFSGKLVSAAWGYREKRSLPPERWHERILPCGEKLEDVRFTNWDFEKVINAPSKNQTLMFIDPPYFLPSKKKHYRHGFTPEDHIRLAEALKKTDHYFFLTYEDTPEVRKLYKWANIYPVNFFYRVGDSGTQGGVRKQGFELVITNYKMSGYKHG